MSDAKHEVENLRRQMAELDLEILRLLEQRAKLAKRVGQLAPGAPHVSGTRERQRITALEQAAAGDLPVDSVRAVFRSIFAACASLERPTRVAYSGPAGALGFVAARQIFGASVEAHSFETSAQALDEAARGRADFAVAPFESSSEGPIMHTILALKQTDLMIVGQCEVPAQLALVNKSGNMAEVDKVYACPQDRLATQVFLKTKLPNAAVIDVDSPVIACQLAAENSAAAIAHENVAEAQGLATVLSNVGDDPELRLRYAVIGSRPSARTGQDSTSLVFTVNDEPGALLAALGHFADRGINLKNIISRPVPGEMWEYLFYVEIAGHVSDRQLIAALDVIKKNTKFVRVLGSYPTQC